MPQVSIVIPARNSAAYIQDCLGSLTSQTFRDFEVLLIDSESTDRTVELALEFKLPLRVLKVPHRGPGAARNRGVEASTGEFIAFLDSDDKWRPHKLAAQMKILTDRAEVGAVYTGISCFEEGRRAFYKQAQCSMPAGHIAKNILLDPTLVTTSTLIFRKSLWNVAGPFDESSPISEDWEWFVRLAAHTPWAVLPEPLVDYRFHSNNTHKYLDRNWPLARTMLSKTIAEYEKRVARCSVELKREIWRQLYLTYGNAHLFHGNHWKAAELYAKAIVKKPSHLKPYFYFAASLVPSPVLSFIQRLRGRKPE